MQYVSDRGVREFREWVDGQPDKRARVRIDEFIRGLQGVREWQFPDTRQLHGPCDGLVELRICCNKVEYRPLGFYASGYRFVLVFGALEKGRGRKAKSNFDPPTACRTALERKKAILERRARICEY
jgi:hypothetical protein